MFNFAMLASENIKDSLRMLNEKLDRTVYVGSRCLSKLDESKRILANLKTDFEDHELDKYLVKRIEWARARDAKQLEEPIEK